MSDKNAKILRARLGDAEYHKLMALRNPKLHQFVLDAVELCAPDSVFVCTDSAEDIRHIREQVKSVGEECTLTTDGHTVHFDGYSDQGRDRQATKYLVPEDASLRRKVAVLALRLEREEADAALLRRIDYLKRLLRRIQRRRRKDSGHGIGAGA